jgi:hypothetical protein
LSDDDRLMNQIIHLVVEGEEGRADAAINTVCLGRDQFYAIY